ncbi:MAG TPA: copper homeostasis protein CutC [Clostridia bacterium]|nr:copper homeostasis protein CutC [Clostridia bacterium]
MRNLKIEVCCNTAADAFAAKEAGAARVELCSALALGGLTPSMGELSAARRADIEIAAIVRPREGGFCYNDIEFETMLADADAMLRSGADGIVFGILHPDGAVDTVRCAKMLEVIGNKTAVFHRAIDVTPDWRAAIDALSELGFDRILTSGQRPTAIEGAATIRKMMDYAAGRIGILPGSGIRLENAEAFVKQTGAAELHVSMRAFHPDASVAANPSIHFGGDYEQGYAATDACALRKLVELFSL